MANLTINIDAVKANWTLIESELKGVITKVSMEALADFGQKALVDIDNRSSYDTDTGNLDDSLMFGIFKNGIGTEWNDPSGYKKKYGALTAGNAEGYNTGGRDAVTIMPSGRVVNIQPHTTMSGREESIKSLDFYERNIVSGNQTLATIVIVAEMFYAAYLQAPDGGKNYLEGFNEYANSISKHEAAYWAAIKEKIKNTRSKNIKAE